MEQRGGKCENLAIYTSVLLTVQVDEEMKQGAELFAHLKQLLKLYTRQRDKASMLSVIEEVGYPLLDRFMANGISLLRSSFSATSSPYSTNPWFACINLPTCTTA